MHNSAITYPWLARASGLGTRARGPLQVGMRSTLRGPGRGRSQLLILLGIGSNFLFPAVHPLFQRFTRFSSGAFACVAIFPAVHPLFYTAAYPLYYPAAPFQRFIRFCMYKGSYPAVHPLQRPIRFMFPAVHPLPRAAAHPLSYGSGLPANNRKSASGSAAKVRKRFSRFFLTLFSWDRDNAVVLRKVPAPRSLGDPV